MLHYFKTSSLFDYALVANQSIQMENIHHFYNTLSFYLIVIVTFVTWMLLQAVFSYNNSTSINKEIIDGRVLEFVWTTIPSLILVSVAVMSFTLLYFLDDANHHDITVKVIGHQWYWTFEYIDPISGESVIKDSYLVPEIDLIQGFRLLEANPLVLPKGTWIRFLVTSADVLHSFSLPSLGIKIDAVPGRLNQVHVNITSGVVAYGQCSELCGVQHGYMPIKAVLVDASISSKPMPTTCMGIRQRIKYPVLDTVSYKHTHLVTISIEELKACYSEDTSVAAIWARLQ